MCHFLILSLTCCACVAQSVSVGVIGGGRATADMSQGATPESRFYDVGPMIDLDLPLGFAFEFDALYHRHGFDIAFGTDLYSVNERERANSWEFPMLLKYKLPLHGIKPFLEVGAAPRTISGTISDMGVTANIGQGGETPFNSSMKTDWSSSLGVVAGGGVQFGIGRLRVSPEVRFTHWTSTPIVLVFSDGPTFYSSQNQLDVLVGISWKIR